MARYLVVAHQTASSPELIERVGALTRGDPGAEFVLLVPATPVQHLLGPVEGEAAEVARRRAAEARARLEEAGAKVARASAVDASPIVAIEGELREHPGEYESIIICTLPIGVSRWLRLDLPHRMERKFALPVIHVVAEPVEAPHVPARPSFDTILVPLKQSHSDSVLETVRSLAKRLDSRVTLAHVLEGAEDGADAESHLERTAQTMRREGVAADTALLRGETGSALIEFARRGRYAVVALETTGPGAAALGDVTSRVLDSCPCPLLLEGPRTGGPGQALTEISRIIVPLDGSGTAEEALPYAEELARRITVPVTLIEVISFACQPVAVPNGEARRSFSDHPLEVESRVDVSTTSYLSEVCRRLIDGGVDASWQAPWGTAPDMILKHVGRDGGSLIVMSSHGASGVGRAPAGGVAQALIRAAPGPVLTVPKSVRE